MFDLYDLNEKSLFSDWLRAWADTKILGMKFSYVSSIESFVSHLSCIDKEISSVRPMDIQSVIQKLSVKNPNTGKPASKKLLKNLRQTAISVFEFAINNCYEINKNPAELVKIPTYASYEKRQALSKEQQSRILDTPHRASLSALIMMLCGLRVGELMALTWDSIDFEHHVIIVNKSAFNVSGNQMRIQNFTKNKDWRKVTIPDLLYQKLMREYENKKYITKYVSTKSDGVDMHTRSSWNRMWESYQQTLGFNFTPHQLRHTYASMLYASGMDIKSSSELLGHKDTQITMNIYTHLMKEENIIPIDKYDEFLNEVFSDKNTKEKEDSVDEIAG